MSPREFQIELERRLRLVDPTFDSDQKMNSNMIFSILNEAKDAFFKTRYSGVNAKTSGFEQSEKRIADLRTLIKTKNYTGGDITEYKDSYSITLPDGFVLMLGDTVGIIPNGINNTWEKDTNDQPIVKYGETLESSIETIDRQKENSLSEHRLRFNSAKPLKLVQDDIVTLFTDGKYKVTEYTLKYMVKPSNISLGISPTVEYTDLPEHTHSEIVKLAVQLYLGMKGTGNYISYSNEVNKME